jgi:hypothetical protein
MSKQIPKPTMAQMAKNFFKSAAVFVAAGMPRASVADIEKRLDFCRYCEHYDEKGYGGMGKCNVCGCNMEIKSAMATEYCPAGKWWKVSANKENGNEKQAH